MAKSSSPGASTGRVPWRDPRFIVRAALGVLLAANVIAAALVMFPPGGSAEELDRQLASLQMQVMQGRAKLERTRAHAAAVESGRKEGDQFMGNYFLGRRTAYTTLVSELNEAATASKIKPRGDAYSTEPIDGSDTLSMMTITANFEGPYKDVLNFVHAIDKSPRLLIIESLSAAPQQGSNILTVSMKLDTFVQEDQSE